MEDLRAEKELSKAGNPLDLMTHMYKKTAEVKVIVLNYAFNQCEFSAIYLLTLMSLFLYLLLILASGTPVACVVRLFLEVKCWKLPRGGGCRDSLFLSLLIFATKFYAQRCLQCWLVICFWMCAIKVKVLILCHPEQVLARPVGLIRRQPCVSSWSFKHCPLVSKQNWIFHVSSGIYWFNIRCSRHKQVY